MGFTQVSQFIEKLSRNSYSYTLKVLYNSPQCIRRLSNSQNLSCSVFSTMQSCENDWRVNFCVIKLNFIYSACTCDATKRTVLLTSLALAGQIKHQKRMFSPSIYKTGRNKHKRKNNSIWWADFPQQQTLESNKSILLLGRWLAVLADGGGNRVAPCVSVI